MCLCERGTKRDRQRETEKLICPARITFRYIGYLMVFSGSSLRGSVCSWRSWCYGISGPKRFRWLQILFKSSLQSCKWASMVHSRHLYNKVKQIDTWWMKIASLVDGQCTYWIIESRKKRWLRTDWPADRLTENPLRFATKNAQHFKWRG